MDGMSMNYSFNYSAANHCWCVDNDAKIFTVILISICLPMILVAIGSLMSQLRNEQVAPVFIINLLISDLTQICIMIIILAKHTDYPADYSFTWEIYFGPYIASVSASVYFMGCISLERYLLMAWPLWYRFRRTNKVYMIVCITGWGLSIALFIFSIYTFRYGLNSYVSVYFFVVVTYLLLPFPLLIFSLVGTIRALCTSQGLPANEKLRIGTILVLIVFTYSLLFLPTILFFMFQGIHVVYFALHMDSGNLSNVSCTLLQLNPLTDLILYVLINRLIIGKFLHLVRRCRGQRDANKLTP